MKIRHNKKRNTAFVYEALLREGTLAILRQEKEKQKKIVDVVKRHFKADSILRQDLECYRSLYETTTRDKMTSEKILYEAKRQKQALDTKALFESQTSLINDINKHISTSVFNNYVPNYKTLATIDQIFSEKTSPTNKILLEAQIIEGMLSAAPPKEDNKIDKVVYNSFVKKFNSKYSDTLLEEQSRLLSHYINSFEDNGVSLKVFLNEEISRLKEQLGAATSTEIIKSDDSMTLKTQQLIEKLNTYARSEITQDVLATVLQTQQIVKDIFDGSSD